MTQPMDHLSEVNDPQTRSKLEGFQETSYSIDEQIIKTKTAMEQKRGVVQAAEIIASRLFQECIPVNKQVDAEEMTPSEAKIRINQIEKLVEIVRNIKAENAGDLLVLKGVVQGLQKAQAAAEAKFQETVIKYERWQRIEAEEAEEQKMADEEAEKATSVAESQQGDAKSSMPVAKSKPISNRVKKATKRVKTKKNN